MNNLDCVQIKRKTLMNNMSTIVYLPNFKNVHTFFWNCLHLLSHLFPTVIDLMDNVKNFHFFEQLGLFP